jgi:hypothetical protein
VTLTTGDAAGIYVLFEHKSQLDPFISWYLLSCMARKSVAELVEIRF